jgi:hypothetical protein
MPQSLYNRWAALELGNTTLYLDNPDQGWICQELDLGYPGVREVIDNSPDQHGTVDRTAFFSQRVVSAKIMAVAAPGWGLDSVVRQFMPFLDPGSRPALHYADDYGGEERVLILRGSQFSSPMGIPPERPFQMTWVAGDPIAKGVTLQEQSVHGGLSGRCRNGGQLPVPPVVIIVGPITRPVVTFTRLSDNSKIGAVALVAGYSVPANSNVVIDTRAKTALLNGDPNQSVFNQVDWAATQWPVLPIISVDDTMFAMTGDPNGLAQTNITAAVVQWNNWYLL